MTRWALCLLVLSTVVRASPPPDSLAHLKNRVWKPKPEKPDAPVSYENAPFSGRIAPYFKGVDVRAIFFAMNTSPEPGSEPGRPARIEPAGTSALNRSVIPGISLQDRVAIVVGEPSNYGRAELKLPHTLVSEYDLDRQEMSFSLNAPAPEASTRLFATRCIVWSSSAKVGSGRIRSGSGDESRSLLTTNHTVYAVVIGASTSFRDSKPASPILKAVAKVEPGKAISLEGHLRAALIGTFGVPVTGKESYRGEGTFAYPYQDNYDLRCIRFNLMQVLFFDNETAEILAEVSMQPGSAAASVR
jgi:hypothetical protein